MGRSLSERTVERDKHVSADVLNWLRPLQQDQTEELKQLLKRDFPEWKTLYGAGCELTPAAWPRARNSDPNECNASACALPR
jgi:hypothetical protein